jgi:hypothetical protein
MEIIGARNVVNPAVGSAAAFTLRSPKKIERTEKFGTLILRMASSRKLTTERSRPRHLLLLSAGDASSLLS